MKRTFQPGLLIAIFLLNVFATAATAQSTSDTPPRYKDVVVENPTAEADMKVVGDFVNALTAGELDKAKNLLAEKYKGYGPGPLDSGTVEQTINSWKESNKVQLNRKVSFVTQTFKVLLGDLKGSWVSVWGDYSFTQDGKNVAFPFQYTARVTDGKIDTDRVYYDRMYIMQTLGYKVTPPEKAK